MLKATSKGLITGAVLSIVSTGALADDGNGLAVGAKVGVVDIDLSGVSSDTAFGLSFGYNFTKSQSVELEYTTGSGSAGLVDVSVDSLALYWAYRSTGKVYFLAKAGVANVKGEIKSSIALYSVSGSDTGLSAGIGGGWRISDSFALEAEYTILDSDATFYGITARFSH